MEISVEEPTGVEDETIKVNLGDIKGIEERYDVEIYIFIKS